MSVLIVFPVGLMSTTEVMLPVLSLSNDEELIFMQGSSGYGRAYVERLAGQWGVVDVEDIIFAARALSLPPYDLIDLKRLVIRGGSSGGLTALAAISNSSDLKLFAAATSLYGISDLDALAKHTHKFEMKYGDNLIGGTPEEIPEVYKHRSPITHADKIVSPLLVSFRDLCLIPSLLVELLLYTDLARRNRQGCTKGTSRDDI